MSCGNICLLCVQGQGIMNIKNVKIQTHKGFKRTLFIRPKHNMPISRESPLSRYKNES